jgi:hypothetical protein
MKTGRFPGSERMVWITVLGWCAKALVGMIASPALLGNISRAIVMVSVMRDLSLHSDIRGRDNVDGTIIGKDWATFCADLVSTLCHSFIAQACFHYDPPDPSILYDRDGLIAVLTEWCQSDNHHKDDPDHRAEITGKIAGHARVARNLRRAASGDDAQPMET